MNIEKYLDDLLKKYDKSNRSSKKEVIKELKKLILSFGHKKISKILLFGSSVKLTNTRDFPSVKLLISIKEKDKRSINEINKWLYDFFATLSKEVMHNDHQFEFSFKGVNFVLVIAKKKENTYNYHFMNSLEAPKQIHTNFDIHTDNVVDNQVQKEIVLMKLWRDKHQLNFPTMYLELVVLHVLRKCKKKNLFSRIIRILDYLRKDFVNDKFYDPSNTNNVISQDLSLDEKLKIQSIARLSLSEEYISDIIF
jgi:hypothetical protein